MEQTDLNRLAQINSELYELCHSLNEMRASRSGKSLLPSGLLQLASNSTAVGNALDLFEPCRCFAIAGRPIIAARR